MEDTPLKELAPEMVQEAGDGQRCTFGVYFCTHKQELSLVSRLERLPLPSEIFP